ncbi:DMT family transporter [Mucilaginibacter sp. FT3.2]|uniref:DMT family transporter n=1 Tax=Mucilaginibacter sp. FT3.2 TaxID=2723090 RepID=UPI001614650C|nr:DMT family transporter [Mucilaginibacter sp. FT3.2]MBB6232774.1 drug/metabolite transporter (DMT)-like permease [Mucilaginibacter sp. FT3.2]
MNNKSFADKTKDSTTAGWINGFLGVAFFSGSMPATKAAVTYLPPVLLTMTRAGIAGILALCALLIFSKKWPKKNQMPSLLIVTLGAVLGFPLLSSWALEYITSARSLVFLGILPLTTAIFGVIRGGERPNLIFWLFAVLGTLIVIGYAIEQGGSGPLTGDIIMLSAVVVCGLGYAEGAKLSRELGGWQVISWALVISLPISIPSIYCLLPDTLSTVPTSAWIGVGYIALFSQFVGFVFWYRGLAQGGIATVGQLQLLQPFLGLTIAAIVLHEHVSPGMIGIMIGVITCVAASKKLAIRKPLPAEANKAP